MNWYKLKIVPNPHIGEWWQEKFAAPPGFNDETLDYWNPETAIPKRQSAINEQRALRFYNYARSKKTAKCPLHHGTTASIYGKILDTEGFLAPQYLKVSPREKRPEAQSQIFFHRYRDSSESYANRAASSMASSAVILHMEIPIFALAEFMAACFRPHVEHPLQYNEHQHHIKLSHIVQNGLRVIDEYEKKLGEQAQTPEGQKKIAAKERKEFKKTLDAVKEHLTTSTGAGEWTVYNRVPLSMVKKVEILNSSLGDSVETLNEKLKSNKDFRKNFKEHLEGHPGDFSLVGKQYKKSKTLQKVVKQAWLKKLKTENTKILQSYTSSKGTDGFIWESIPDMFLQDPEINEQLQNLVPQILKGFEKFESNEPFSLSDFANFFGKFPYLIRTQPEVEAKIKTIFLKLAPQFPDQFMTYAKMLPAIFWKDTQWVNQLVQAVIPHMTKQSWAYFKVNNVPPEFYRNKAVMEAAFTNSPLGVNLKMYDEREVEPFIPLLKQKLNESLGKNPKDIISSGQALELPKIALDQNNIDTLAAAAIELLTTNYINYVGVYWNYIPTFLKEREDVRNAAIASLTKLSQSYSEISYYWPEDLRKDPKLAPKLTELAIKAGYYHLANPKFLKGESLVMYEKTMVSALETNPSAFASIPEKWRKKPSYIEALIKGCEYQAEYGGKIPSDESFDNLPQFKAIKPKLITAILKGKYFYRVAFKELTEEQKPLYIEKLKDKLASSPTFVTNNGLFVPEEVMALPDMQVALMKGWKNLAESGYSVDLNIFKNDNFMEEKLDILKVMISHGNPGVYDSCTPALKQKFKEIFPDLLMNNISLYDYSPPELRKDDKIIAIMVQKIIEQMSSGYPTYPPYDIEQSAQWKAAKPQWDEANEKYYGKSVQQAISMKAIMGSHAPMSVILKYGSKRILELLEEGKFGWSAGYSGFLFPESHIGKWLNEHADEMSPDFIQQAKDAMLNGYQKWMWEQLNSSTYIFTDWAEKETFQNVLTKGPLFQYVNKMFAATPPYGDPANKLHTVHNTLKYRIPPDIPEFENIKTFGIECLIKDMETRMADYPNKKDKAALRKQYCTWLQKYWPEHPLSTQFCAPPPEPIAPPVATPVATPATPAMQPVQPQVTEKEPVWNDEAGDWEDNLETPKGVSK